MSKPTDSPPAGLTAVGSIRGWREFFDEGKAYLRTAVAAHDKRQDIFTAEILYNIIAMAMEKFVMAALMRHNTMPYNHTMADLVEAMEESFPGIMAEIREGMLRMDKYQEICALDTYRITPPALDEIPAMLDLASRLQGLVEKKLLAGKSENEAETLRDCPERRVHVRFEGDNTSRRTG